MSLREVGGGREGLQLLALCIDYVYTYFGTFCRPQRDGLFLRYGGGELKLLAL